MTLGLRMTGDFTVAIDGDLSIRSRHRENEARLTDPQAGPDRQRCSCQNDGSLDSGTRAGGLIDNR